jgi:hypothetical protein
VFNESGNVYDLEYSQYCSFPIAFSPHRNIVCHPTDQEAEAKQKRRDEERAAARKTDQERMLDALGSAEQVRKMMIDIYFPEMLQGSLIETIFRRVSEKSSVMWEMIATIFEMFSRTATARGASGAQGRRGRRRYRRRTGQQVGQDGLEGGAKSRREKAAQTRGRDERNERRREIIVLWRESQPQPQPQSLARTRS